MTTQNFAGFTITLSKKGRPMRPSIAKMLSAPDAPSRLVCVRTSSFDGMIDGSRAESTTVSPDALAAFVRDGGNTFCAYFHADYLAVSDACYSYEIRAADEDPNAARRELERGVM